LRVLIFHIRTLPVERAAFDGPLRPASLRTSKDIERHLRGTFIGRKTICGGGPWAVLSSRRGGVVPMSELQNSETVYAEETLLLAGYLKPKDLAKALDASKRTIARWYHFREGLLRVEIGRGGYYRRESAIAWIASCERLERCAAIASTRDGLVTPHDRYGAERPQRAFGTWRRRRLQRRLAIAVRVLGHLQSVQPLATAAQTLRPEIGIPTAPLRANWCRCFPGATQKHPSRDNAARLSTARTFPSLSSAGLRGHL
jgi:hypothetical protein